MLSLALPLFLLAPIAPMQETAHAHTNRLIDETSPYLLQHAHNPVDWYPWGEEALSLAKRLDKPIFLSIGYSACHWCHVMEHECFENERIAAVMNEHFVNIKVDREERPDIDEIYMKAVMAISGSGGWPMSVFLTPDLKPYYGGTYFPPEDRMGRPGFPRILLSMSEAWKRDREKVVKSSEELAGHIATENHAESAGDLPEDVLERSFTTLSGIFDPIWGGFGSAPKFPHAMDVRIMLRHWRRTGNEEALKIATISLDRMMEGGVYDQLGGGFHRYSTDERWLIPHFEKMLYDNAQLIPAYLEAYSITGEEKYARVVRETCEWTLREMVTPQGGFASTQDADSEGEEGKFFAWTPDELIAVLGQKHGVWAAAYWDVTEAGNFEHGTSALWRHESLEEVAGKLHEDPAELAEAMRVAREKLFEAREKRIKPGWDDKVLASWNGLMISAMARAWQVLGEDRYLEAAKEAANYVLEHMRQEDGRLYATARHGHAHLNAYLDDYVFLIAGLIELYQCDFDPRWLREALELNDVLTERFEDPEHGGYFTTGKDHEKLIARLKAPHDGALPSGQGVQVQNLLRLAELTGDPALAKRAERTIKSLGRLVAAYPQAFSTLLYGVDTLACGPREVVIAGELGAERTEGMLAAVRKRYLPEVVVALADSRADTELMPLLEGREPAEDGGARAYVCKNYTCKLPVDAIGDLVEQLEAVD